MKMLQFSETQNIFRSLMIESDVILASSISNGESQMGSVFGNSSQRQGTNQSQLAASSIFSQALSSSSLSNTPPRLQSDITLNRQTLFNIIESITQKCQMKIIRNLLLLLCSCKLSHQFHKPINEGICIVDTPGFADCHQQYQNHNECIEEDQSMVTEPTKQTEQYKEENKLQTVSFFHAYKKLLLQLLEKELKCYRKTLPIEIIVTEQNGDSCQQEDKQVVTQQQIDQIINNCFERQAPNVFRRYKMTFLDSNIEQNKIGLVLNDLKASQSSPEIISPQVQSGDNDDPFVVHLPNIQLISDLFYKEIIMFQGCNHNQKQRYQNLSQKQTDLIALKQQSDEAKSGYHRENNGLIGMTQCKKSPKKIIIQNSENQNKDKYRQKQPQYQKYLKNGQLQRQIQLTQQHQSYKQPRKSQPKFTNLAKTKKSKDLMFHN